MNLNLLISYAPHLLHGIVITVVITIISFAMGAVGGLGLALAEQHGNRWAKYAVNIYGTIMRGTPMIVQIACYHFVLPQIGICLPPLITAILAIGLNSAAYMIRIIQAGLRSISHGQKEAAHVLGFTRMQTIQYILLPQAFRVMLPLLGNELITLAKDSSLASTIGVAELFKETRLMMAASYDVTTAFGLLAVFYIAVTCLIQIVVNHMQKKLDWYARY